MHRTPIQGPHLSRRQLLIASGGLAITACTPGVASSQEAATAKDLIFRTNDPRNAEPALEKVVQSWMTPTRHFYVRSHAPNPVIDIDQYKLRVEGLVRTPVTLSFAQLSRFPQHKVIATLTCAGNRRAEFNADGKVGGVQWDAGAIGNATWQGIALADVLQQAELLEGAKHVWFEGLDQIERPTGVIPFGASIPIEKALQTGEIPGTVLAHQMNDAPLTADHGYPLRTVVPGYIGARSVKWLGKIVVSDRPSPNHYVATAYKIVTETESIDWSEAGPIYRFPINAAICTPGRDSRVAAGEIEVAGYALPSGRDGSQITAVSVSADQGATWQRAELTGTNAPYCWQLWKANINVGASTKQLMVRANDSSGAFMPPRIPWNAKGYLQNSWYRCPITVQ